MDLRELPSVDELSSSLADVGWARAVTVEVARQAITESRRLIEDGQSPDPAELARIELARLGRMRPTRLINATGVLLNTNLGRAPVHPAAAAAAQESLTGYSNLEFDLAGGKRGNRSAYARHLVAQMTGAEDALVVNNNSGALFLALTALANELQVVVSRGELIEIGGSFRLPELMAASGAWLMEVGTTNRTRLDDYQDAIGAETALILKVHPSNYQVVGFTEEVPYGDLAELAHRHKLPLVADVGSGLLDGEAPWLEGPPPPWLAGEPAVRQTVSSGADLVLFSGDKLLGGPQAGIIAGTADLVKRMARHPVARALRCDGSTLAGLTRTLELYADGRGGEVPFWAMVAKPFAELEERAAAIVAKAGTGQVMAGESVVGAGSVPHQVIPSPVIRVEHSDVNGVWMRLLAAQVAIASRRHEGALLLDLRAVDPTDDSLVANTLRLACRS